MELRHTCYRIALVLLLAGCGGEVELEHMTVEELRSALAAGELSSVDIVEGYLDRIEAMDPRLNAILEINPDALRIAAQLDEERARGNIRSRLHGIPVLLKDNIDTADRMRTTAGSLTLMDAPTPSEDAFLVQQLREAGAIILGKTNLSEWANFRSTASSSGWSAVGGQTRNAYILDRTPCGSSSGSAVAVAADLAPLAVGTETDGSVICPSANNGVVGIKPTVGLVSRSGIVPISHSQDTAGPMAKTVAGAAALLTAMAGADPRDEATANAPLIDYTAYLDADGLWGRRIGVLREFFGRNSKTDALMEKQLKVLEEGGATLVDVEIPTLKEFGDFEFQVLLYEFKHDINAYLEKRGGPYKTLSDLVEFNREHADAELRYFGQELFEQSLEKGDLASEEYREALEKSRQMTRDQGIDAVLKEHELDALVAPSNSTAWKIDLINGDGGADYVSSSGLAAVAGYPNITVPAGIIRELPVGISFIGRVYGEPGLISIAYAFEQRSKARRPPKFIASYEQRVSSSRNR